MTRTPKFLWLLILALLAWTAPLPAAQKTASKSSIPKTKSAAATPLPEIKPSAPPAGAVAAGTRFATPYFVKSSAAPGPRVLVLGGVHGDEPSGATAAALIEHWPIARGTLMIVPRANVPGLAAHTRNIPASEKGLENLNRNFPRARKNEPPRGEAAIALWTRIQDFKPDWVIDLHEGFAVHQQNDKSVGSSIIATTGTACQTEARRLLGAVNATIPDATKHFVLLRLPVDGSIARAVGEHLGANAMILETTSRGQPLETRTRQHRTMVRTLLQDLNMFDENLKME